jgi:hypothetical protein
VAVNNAAITPTTPVMQITPEEFDGAGDQPARHLPRLPGVRRGDGRGRLRPPHQRRLAGRAERRHGVRRPLRGVEGRHPDPHQDLRPERPPASPSMRSPGPHGAALGARRCRPSASRSSSR